MNNQFDEIIERALMDTLRVLDPTCSMSRGHGRTVYHVGARGELFTATSKSAALCMAIERCNELDALTNRLVN